MEAIDKVLRAVAPQALHKNEIASRIIDGGLRKKAGATPDATVASALLTAIKKQGDASPYEKVGPGKFRMRNVHEPESTHEVSQTTDAAETESDEPRDIVTSFGVYWEREAVDWKAKPRLYGEFQTDGVSKTAMTRVDFAGQHGLYLLHDVREVIYVGRATKGDLGQRLYHHTRDRLRGRWSRFSWFGFRPVSEDGKLGARITQLPPDCGMDNLITAVEAILIEALEPRQNKKSGDGIAASEYRQIPDPAIEGKRLRDAIARLTGS